MSSKQRRVRVIYSFYPSSSQVGALILKKSEIIIVTQEPIQSDPLSSNDNAYGRKEATGEEGYFPLSKCESMLSLNNRGAWFSIVLSNHVIF